MNHLATAAIVFFCVFGSALVGLYVRDRLPEHHLSEESIGVVKLATGLIATMAALVLGLLVSSANRAFDVASSAVIQNAANVIQFDHALAKYGPDTQAIRLQLKDTYAGVIQLLASGDKAQLILLGSSERIALGEDIQRKVEAASSASWFSLILNIREGSRSEFGITKSSMKEGHRSSGSAVTHMGSAAIGRTPEEGEKRKVL